MPTTFRTLGLSAAFAVLATPALAHIGLHEQGGFGHGFAHPMTGLDHVAAMVAVGMLAAQLGGRAVLLAPAAFVGMMAAGCLLGFAGVALPFVEQGVGLSVVALGVLVALGVRMPTVLAMATVGLFGIFHGHAHAAELPFGDEPAEFAAGFLLATALLHAAGAAFGLTLARIGRSARPWAARMVGAAMAVFGISLFA